MHQTLNDFALAPSDEVLPPFGDTAAFPFLGEVVPVLDFRDNELLEGDCRERDLRRPADGDANPLPLPSRDLLRSEFIGDKAMNDFFLSICAKQYLMLILHCYSRRPARLRHA